MIELLIVDDEIAAVQGIRCSIDWERLGITSVFTVYDIQQAKERFECCSINIMLCDIEMPQGSGLELLAWVKHNYPKTECIFLTCHADFTYAKQAIQLGSLDYLLKPLPTEELEAVIVKAINKIKEGTELTEYNQFGKIWFKQKSLFIEHFWQDVFNQRIPSNKDVIEKELAIRCISYDENVMFLPVMIKVQHWHEDMNINDEKLMMFALKNSGEEMIIKGDGKGLMFEVNRETLLIVLYLKCDRSPDVNGLVKELDAYISACNCYFCCDISCYIGEKSFLYEMVDMVEKLSFLDKNNVTYINKVFVLNRQVQASSTIQIPDMSLWSKMLNEGLKDKMLEEMIRYLNNLVNTSYLNAEILHQFQQDFLQMVYTTLKQKCISAHQLLSNSDANVLLDRPIRSVSELILWISQITESVISYINEMQKSESVIESSKRFITTHLEQEFTCEDIANHVYLNSDYLTRIFKKETGLTLNEYIINERISLAKKLLLKTEMSINSIATQLGYANPAQFSKIFKKYTQTNPMDFRQKEHKE